MGFREGITLWEGFKMLSSKGSRVFGKISKFGWRIEPQDEGT